MSRLTSRGILALPLFTEAEKKDYQVDSRASDGECPGSEKADTPEPLCQDEAGPRSRTAVTRPDLVEVRWDGREPLRAPGEDCTREDRPTDPGQPERPGLAIAGAVLVRMDGPEAGRVYPIDKDALLVGRGPENDIVIEGSGISRRHARVRREGGHFTVDDLGSLNGTYVRGERIEHLELRTGDYIQLGGRTTLSFQNLDTQQQDLLRQLYESSTQDGLTGICNRRHFNDRMAAEIAFSRRHGTAIGLLLIDVDHFKSINDQYGHCTGDSVLRQLAGLMGRQLRTEDLFARIGGEEFAVVLRGISIEGCARLAERLCATVAAEPFGIGDQSLPLTVSIGCASMKGPEVTLRGLMGIADQRLYEAKRQGRNRAVAEGCGRIEQV